MEEIVTDWIEEFESIDERYKDFYKEPINSIKLVLLYIDRNNELFHVKKEKIKIKENTLKNEELLKILRSNLNYNKKTYRPLSILKYNMDLSPYDVKDYTINNNKYNFLTAQKNLEDIKWKDTIKFFHNINSLYILFYEKWNSKNNNTRRIFINKHKKLNAKKTRKKRFKGNLRI